jgi:uncharacterized BrkB/YihY/UPF0761 family membrane protein
MSDHLARPPGDQRSTRERIAAARGRVDDLRRQATDRFDVERGRRPSVRAAVAFYERDRRFAGGLLAGGLAFRIFLWLLPLALVAATTLGLYSDVFSQSPSTLARDSGMSAAIVSSVNSAVSQTTRGRGLLLLTGVALLLWLGRSLLRALKVVCHLAWGMEGSTRSSIRASAALTGYILAFLAVPWLARVLYRGGFFTDLLAGVVMVIIFSALSLEGLRLLPHPEVPWQRLLPGAVLLGLGAEGIRLFVSLYLAAKLERSEGLYGSLGLAVVFLAWLYLVGRLIVAAVNLNATLWGSSRLEASAGDPGTVA